MGERITVARDDGGELTLSTAEARRVYDAFIHAMTARQIRELRANAEAARAKSERRARRG